MVDPVCQVLRREHMIVGHAKPILTLSGRRNDVMRRIEIHFTVEHTSRRVGSKLIADNRVLCFRGQKCKDHKDGQCAS